MTAGYSSAGQCWETAAEAIDAYFSASLPQLTGVYSGSAHHVTMTPSRDASGVWSFHYQSCPYNSSTCLEFSKLAPTNVYGVCTIQASNAGAAVPMGLPEGFDYSFLGALFAFTFSVVVGLWLFGKSAGSIVNIFKPKN